VELTTLEELTALVDRFGEILISEPNYVGAEYAYELEIVDTYR
jgi:hypothetical protein